MKTTITGIRIQKMQEKQDQDQDQPGGTGGTPPPPKPENEDVWSDDQDQPPPRDPETGEPDFGDGETEPSYEEYKGPLIPGEILPTGALGDSKEKPESKGKGDIPSDLEEKWDNALKNAQGTGETPLGVKRALAKLKAPVIDWRSALATYIDEAISKVKYKLPARRFLGRGEAQYGYKRYKEDFENVVVSIDTSGSINRHMIEQFLSEVMGITAAYTPQKTVILYCDTRVYEPDILEPGDEPDFDKIRGGGGTNFWPPFEWVEKNMIDEGEIPTVFIYFTDGEATFPREEEYSINQYSDRCIWVFLTFNGSPFPHPQPFGSRIDIALANKSIKEI